MVLKPLKSLSNRIQIFMNLLVNLDFFYSIIYDKTYNEFNCNLKTGASVVMTKQQYQSLNYVIRIF